MKVQELGNSDLEITAIGVGAWAIGGGQGEFGWGPQEDNESIAAIHAALDYGMNWIDTAAAYGLGHSETVVGRAVRGLRQRPYVFTKCSLVWDESGKISHNLQADSIRAEAEASLKRLNVDTIDLYQIHWPTWQGHPESASPGSIEEAVGAMAKLRAEGKIRHIGVSNFNARQMERALAVAPITSLQPPYSLLAPDVESSTLPFALKHNHRRHRVFPDGVGTSHRRDDSGTNRAISRRRLAQAQSEFPGTAAYAQSRPGRVAARDRRAAQRNSWRSRHRVDLEESGCHGGDRRHPKRSTGERHRRGPGCEAKPGRGVAD